MNWYSTLYRRHLCDMHIADWDEKFLSEFSPEDYVANLKESKIQLAMIYLQSHFGLCNWPTKSGKTHNHFIKKPNDIKVLIDLCRKNGIKVIGYYSLNFNQWAHDEHKDWRMLTENGVSCRENNISDRSGLCCPNNKNYRNFVYEQIDEMLDYFELDGMFFDMLYWPHVCYCDACKEKYYQERGKGLPYKNKCSYEEWFDFCDMRAKWMGEWAMAVSDYVHSKKPDMPVEHNLSAATSGYESGCRDLVARATDYAGGDLYGGPFSQAFVCNFYRHLSNNQPFEYMTGRCTPNLLTHTVSKTKDQLEQHIMHTCAHHGAFLAIDAIDPVGTMDARVYKTLGEINSKEVLYEPYLTGEAVEDIGLLYSMDSAVNLQNPMGTSQSFLHFATTKRTLNNQTACIQASKHLIGAHIPFGVITKKNVDAFKNYRVIVAPNLNRLDGDTVDALIDYVKNGGCLYFNNCDEKKLFETLIGGKYLGHTPPKKPYIYPTENNENLMPDYSKKYPLPIETAVPMVEGIDKENVLAYIAFAYTSREESIAASFHSDPPGELTKWPAIVEKNYGKGKVIWSAAAPEYHISGDYASLFVEIIKRLLKSSFSVYSNANRNIEIVSFKDRNTVRVSAVNLTELENLFTMPDFTVTVKTGNKVKSVKKLPDGSELPFVLDGEFTTFTVKDLRIMDMFEIELGGE